MIGRSLTRWILKGGFPYRIILPVRDIAKAEVLYKDLPCSDYEKLCFVRAQLLDIHQERFPMPVDHIIHCACITQSREMAAHPVETADSIVIGTKNILELARIKHVTSMVYVSSMEVYGKVEASEGLTKEDCLGELDLRSSRSCYPMGKRMAEHYCNLYVHEYNVPVKIARLAQTFGRGASPTDNRVYMQFARAICEGKDIVLKTSGMSMGNYCAIEDTIEGIWTILHKGKDGEAYNVVNEANTMRIRDMARLAAYQVAGGKIQVKIEGEGGAKYGYAPDTGLRLSGEKLRGLGWRPSKGLAEMYKNLVEELQMPGTGKADPAK